MNTTRKIAGYLLGIALIVGAGSAAKVEAAAGGAAAHATAPQAISAPAAGEALAADEVTPPAAVADNGA